MTLVTQITIAGNLTRDPELRTTTNGTAVVSFSVASTPRSFNKETKQYEDGETVYTNCTLWGRPAENLASSIKKGNRVLVSGTLKTRKYQSNGEQKTATELVVDEVGASLMFNAVDVIRNGGGRKAVQNSEPATDGWNRGYSSDEPF